METNIYFNDDYEHKIPYEINFHAIEINRQELLNINQDKVNELYEEFEENRSAYAFSDCDDYPHPFDPDMVDNEISSLKKNDGQLIEEIVNEFEEPQALEIYKFVFFYIYEENSWGPMETELPVDINLMDVSFKVIWSRVGDLKYIDRLTMSKISNNELLETIYPYTDEASAGNKYNGEIYFMLVDSSNEPITEKIVVQGSDIPEIIKKALE